jgi:hypothetical protein
MTPNTTQELLHRPATEQWTRSEFTIVRRDNPHPDWLPVRSNSGRVSWLPRGFARWLIEAPTTLPKGIR